MARQPLLGQGLLIVDTSRSQSDTPHSVELLCTSDQPDAETSTWLHLIFKRVKYSCTRGDSNPQCQQSSGRRPTPKRARPLGSAIPYICQNIILAYIMLFWHRNALSHGSVNSFYNLSVEVPTKLLMKITVLWCITPCQLLVFGV
jgi:hypothetical protein